MYVCGLAWPPRHRARDATGPRARRPRLQTVARGLGSAVSPFRSRADAHRVMIAVISHRFDGHVQLDARRRGHRLGARCCVRGVVVCVEIRFHGDGFNCAQDNLTRSQVVVPLLQAGEGRPQGGGHRVQRRRNNGRPEGRAQGIDEKAASAASGFPQFVQNFEAVGSWPGADPCS